MKYMDETQPEVDKLPHEMNALEFQAWLELEPEHKEQSEDGQYFHVPIAFLEPDLRKTYGGRIEIKIKTWRETLGAFVIEIRLKVFHPVYKEWLSYDGIAAVPMHSVTPGEWVGSTKAVQIDEMKTGVPSAYSIAIQNAAKKIGRRFGSDINRVSTPANKLKPEEKKAKAIDDRITMLIEGAENIAELNEMLPHLGENEAYQKAFNDKLQTFKNSKTTTRKTTKK